MKKTDLISLIALPIVLLLGILVALAGSQGGSSWAGYPIFAFLVGVAFLLQWLVFIPSFLLQTEKYFDITGGVTYILVFTLALFLTPSIDLRSLLLYLLCVVWAVRLASFLFKRVHVVGKDDRFDEIKPSFFRFLNAWNLQGLWIVFTASAALIAITSLVKKELDGFAIIGALVWLAGFAFETIADMQKNAFKADPANQGRFIRTGLWSKSRHPNYFGEIILWLGIAIIAMPVLQGWQWVGMISPLFVALLLMRVSGVPMLEAKAEQKWGGQPDYEEYKKNTPVLLPKL